MEKYPKDKHPRKKHPISAKLDHFWGLQDAPKFWPHLDEKLNPRPQKSKFLKNEKNTPDIHPRKKCTKFQPNPTIFEVSRLPQSFSLVLAKNSSPGPKNQNFWQMKKHLKIFIQGRCVPNFSQIFEVSRLPLSFVTDRQTDRQKIHKKNKIVKNIVFQ